MTDFKINVFDDVFDIELTKEIWTSLMRPKWSMTGGSSESRFWHMENLHEEDFYNKKLFYIVCDKLGEKPSSFKIDRCYANGQTANQNGTAHSDDDRPNTFTFLYYPNPEWHWEWNGGLFFLNHLGSHAPPNTEIVKTVSYKPNRGIFFPANICHYASAPSNSYKGLRISLAWKLSRFF
tara:strand:- start:1310 stop:1846 length:537 start_codon:yes stop_codon:yes gene_type:complete